MATGNRYRGRRRRIDLVLAITTSVAVLTLFTVLAGYRAGPRNSSDFVTVAVSGGGATLTLSPASGQAGMPFTASFQIPVGTCFSSGNVNFTFDGGAPVPKRYDVPTCTAQAMFTPPVGTPPGGYVVTAQDCPDSCGVKLTDRYIVLPPPPTPAPTPIPYAGSITVAPTHDQAGNTFTAVYHVSGDSGEKRIDQLLGNAGVGLADDNEASLRLREKDAAHVFDPTNKTIGLDTKILSSLALHVVLIADTDDRPPVLGRDLVKNRNRLFWRNFEMKFLSCLTTLLRQPNRIGGHSYRVTGCEYSHTLQCKQNQK